MELDIPWLVYTVHVAETSGDREIGANWLQSLVDLVDDFRLSVERVVVDVFVVYTIFFTTGDPDLLFDTVSV